ncbi:MAG: PD40 domain-containing protein, partial [Acidobacteria bacterium]|nr:PD40 domain-containing protein [Acidobacteriota bacterium]
QYMSPEQLEGREADPRSDLFALGAVMYEMLAGRKAFEGKSQASLIAAIIHVDPPPVSVLKPVTPAALDRVVKKCLVKDPDERWQTAKDLVDELRWIAEGGHTASLPAQPVPAAAVHRSRWSLAAAAVFFLTTAVLATLILLHREPRTPGLIRLSVEIPDKTDAGNSVTPNYAISPDGRFLAFSAGSSARTRVLWVRPFDAPASQPLAETAGAQHPFWSPDGRFIGFFAGGKLKKVEISGGIPLTLCNVRANVGEGGTWNKDGAILFSTEIASNLFRVSENGGEPVAVTKLGDKETGHVWPQFLPDGRHFIYLSLGKAAEDSAVYAASLDGESPKRIVKSEGRAAYAAGHLFFVRENVLMAQPFDPERFELTGEPVRVAEQVASGLTSGRAGFAVSESGTVAYRTNVSQDGSQQFAWFDRGGKRTDIVTDPAQYRTHDLSPGGRRLAAHRHDANSNKGDIWIVELDRRLSTRFTFDNAHSLAPIWSPDGSRIAYASVKEGAVADLYQKLASGAANEELLLKTTESKQTLDWSRDNRFILFEAADPKTRLDLWVLPLSGDRKPVPFLKTPFNERKGRFSPDGKWIAYTSDESGQQQVYIQPFPPNGGKWQISTAGGLEPQWRGDGKELFYLSAQAQDAPLMAVPIKWTSVPEAGRPQELFPISTGNMGVDNTNHYVAAPDGQRFVIQVNTAERQAEVDSIIVLVNWLASLK